MIMGGVGGICGIARFVIIAGIASQYAAGVSQSVIDVRQRGRTAYDLPQNLPGVTGFVAVPLCADIGTIIYLRPVGTLRWESFLVIDCASKSGGSPIDGQSSYDWMKLNNILVEVDHETAVRWNTVGRAIDIEMLTIKEGFGFE